MRGESVEVDNVVYGGSSMFNHTPFTYMARKYIASSQKGLCQIIFHRNGKFTRFLVLMRCDNFVLYVPRNSAYPKDPRIVPYGIVY